MPAQSTSIPVVPDSLKAEVAQILAQLDQTDASPHFSGLSETSLVIPLWMVTHILNAPQDVTEFLYRIRAADFSPEVFRRSAHLDPDRTADYIFQSLQGRDRNDVQGNRELISKLLMGLGIFAGLSMLIALTAAILFMKLGPIGVVLGVITLLIGFIILLATAVIMVVIAAVLAIIGHHKVAVSVTLEPATPAPLGAG